MDAVNDTKVDLLNEEEDRSLPGFVGEPFCRFERRLACPVCECIRAEFLAEMEVRFASGCYEQVLLIEVLQPVRDGARRDVLHVGQKVDDLIPQFAEHFQVGGWSQPFPEE